LAIAAFITVSREKSLHNDVIARFTISGVNHRFSKCRSVRFTDAGISPYDQNNRLTRIRLSLSLAVLEEALPLALWLPCVTSRQHTLLDDLPLFAWSLDCKVSGPIAQTIRPYSTQAESDSKRRRCVQSLAAHAAPEPVLQLLDGVGAIVA
jgi:hypothetical protein